MKRFLTLIISILVLTFSHVSFASWFSNDTKLADLKLQSGVVIPEAKDIKPFSLTASDGKPFTEKSLQNQWTLMFFGFTNCPALCPTTMAQLANAYKKLQEEKFTPMPQVIFVSVDPERDTLERIATFAHAFNPAFIGARGDMATLTTLTRELDSIFTKVDQAGKDKDKKGTYTIDHTGDIIVINPKGQFAAMLTMPHKSEDIVKDYGSIVKAAA